MLRVLFAFILALSAAIFPASAGEWHPDILGDGYTMQYIDQPDDYSGQVRCTVVRKLSSCARHRAILYIHGYNDYFFQSELGNRMVDSCFNFYALDLRKYGRSIIEGQTPYQVRDMHEYFADINSALSVIASEGNDEVVLMGHSTGGLLAALYMSMDPSPLVKALILNSPFLEWNLNGFTRSVLIPAVGCLASKFPNMSISQGNSSGYAESLLKQYHGEWNFNTDWKTVHPRKVQASWLRAIDNAHAALQNGAKIMVPILLMHSDKSIKGDKWTPEFQTGDAVLNVNDIAKYGRRLGPNVTEVTVPDGLHDLLLSRPDVRNAAYQAIFSWLSRQGL